MLQVHDQDFLTDSHQVLDRFRIPVAFRPDFQVGLAAQPTAFDFGGDAKEAPHLCLTNILQRKV